ncbi:MAG: ATP-binding cassette domain-containing protein, partial [Oscillospiraceae bacterium]|nr:ATP-binding cassette domain-containing protein [Oscillospiraceae bacterium]
MALLQTENLSYIYGEGTPFCVTALDKVNIEIEKGGIVAVIGHTGSGKSTLMQQLNGLLKPTSGRVLIDGEDIRSSKAKKLETRFRVGLCFQYPEYQLFENTVYEDIAFGPKNMGLSEAEVDKRVRDAAKYVGIPDSAFTTHPFD